ncbi:unnamed protein product [Trichogramma brassicae]|uniref:Uncharacterized protein n=1 Tax=Trichogramma brassicae TaxID=86971 RepID=A0A6H5ICI1_9HYME|nr:unnamed protein product [Trichogramma brassicae]
MREEVKLEVAKERKAFLVQFHSLIGSWTGKLPNLRDIFRPDEIELLLAESVEFDTKFKAAAFIQFLIQTGYKDEAEVVDKDGGNNVRVTAVHHAARRGYIHRNYLINDLFIIYDRFDSNYSDENGYTHFHVACESGCEFVVKKFLELGQDPDCRNNKSESIRRCTWPWKANQACVYAKMLFEIGDEGGLRVRVDAQDKLGNTPFHLALRYGNKKLFESLLRRISDPNLADVEGLTPLHIICQRFNKEEYLRMFFKLNDDHKRLVRVNAEDRCGNTPLHLALSEGRMGVSKLLMARGADPNLANKDGETPLHLICKRDDSDGMMETLYEICDRAKRKVQANAWDNSNRTPLQWAVARLLPKTANLLLDRGADLSWFEFPSETQFDEAWKFWKNTHSYRARLAPAALAIVERLQREDYRLDRSDALTLMRLFKRHDLFKKPFKPEVGRLCRKWAVGFFLTLTHYRLPILCCDMILDDLEDDDIWSMAISDDLQQHWEQRMEREEKYRVSPALRHTAFNRPSKGGCVRKSRSDDNSIVDSDTIAPSTPWISKFLEPDGFDYHLWHFHDTSTLRPVWNVTEADRYLGTNLSFHSSFVETLHHEVDKSVLIVLTTGQNLCEEPQNEFQFNEISCTGQDCDQLQNEDHNTDQQQPRNGIKKRCIMYKMRMHTRITTERHTYSAGPHVSAPSIASSSSIDQRVVRRTRRSRSEQTCRGQLCSTASSALTTFCKYTVRFGVCIHTPTRIATSTIPPAAAASSHLRVSHSCSCSETLKLAKGQIVIEYYTRKYKRAGAREGLRSVWIIMNKNNEMRHIAIVAVLSRASTTMPFSRTALEDSLPRVERAAQFYASSEITAVAELRCSIETRAAADSSQVRCAKEREQLHHVEAVLFLTYLTNRCTCIVIGGG